MEDVGTGGGFWSNPAASAELEAVELIWAAARGRCVEDSCPSLGIVHRVVGGSDGGNSAVRA